MHTWLTIFQSMIIWYVEHVQYIVWHIREDPLDPGLACKMEPISPIWEKWDWPKILLEKGNGKFREKGVKKLGRREMRTLVIWAPKCVWSQPIIAIDKLIVIMVESSADMPTFWRIANAVGGLYTWNILACFGLSENFNELFYIYS